MIWDSQPWKSELRRVAREIAALRTLRRWTNRAGFRLEKAVMLGFFAVRRLHEAHKVTDRTMNAGVRLVRHDPLGPAPDISNWHRVDEHYDLQRGHDERLSLKTFCNQAIHSFVFIPGEGEAGLPGVYLASEWERRRALLYVSLVEVERVFLEVAADVVQHAVYKRKKGNPSEFTVSLE